MTVISLFLVNFLTASPLLLSWKVYNLLRLCELLVMNCRNLKCIQLLTGKEPGNSSKQEEMLGELKQSLSKNGVLLSVDYSTTLHDREIR